MIDKDAVKARLDLREVARESVQLGAPNGKGECSALCPFHDDRETSLSVNKTLFKCFSCDAAGDVFTWCERVWNVPFLDALQRLAERTGLAPTPRQPREAADLDPGLAGRCHNALTAEHRAYYHERGLDDTTIDRFQLGWEGRRYAIPLYVDGKLVNIRLRRNDLDTKDHGPKMLPYRKGLGTVHLFNASALDGADIAIIAEGEFDAILLSQHGWHAVSSTGGAETFKAEWVSLFADVRDIFIVYDNDDAGRSGARKVAALFGTRARIVELPPEVGSKGDVTDYFVRLDKTDADFAELVEAARPYVEEAEGEEEPELVHLALTTRPELVGRLVTVRVLVAGKIDTPYLVPRDVAYSCSTSPDKCTFHDGNWTTTFDDRSTVLIECCHQKKEKVEQIMRAEGEACPGCRRVVAKVQMHAKIEQALVVPIADRITPQHGIDVDERGYEYVQRTVYVLEKGVGVNQRYALTGRVYPDPKTQMGTLLVSEVKPLQDNIDEFTLTPELIDAFKVFQPAPDGNLVDHVESLLADLTEHTTHIYKRDAALLAVLLGYHSIIRFPFEGGLIRRGWVEVLLLGDTGQAKTALVRALMDACGLGTLASGETTRRTGLTYSIEQVGERWFVKWGKYPLADRRLLVLDELSELPEDDLKQMTQARNDGVISVDRAGVGTTYCRTRLIFLSNPRGKKTLGEYAHGVEALRDVFPVPADQRRVDIAVWMATGDVDSDEINREHVPDGDQKITGDVLKASILWAWSRRANQVAWETGAHRALLDEATSLSHRYGIADDVPLVSPADMREKLARLAVAFAALVHSTDASHEIIKVTVQHVRFVRQFLDSIYTARNCRYDVYAQRSTEKRVLTEKEAGEIWGKLRELDHVRQGSLAASDRSLGEEVVNLYRRSENYAASELGDLLDIDRRTVTSRLRILQQHQLVQRTRWGFSRTPKFIDFLNDYAVLEEPLSKQNGNGYHT